MGSAAAIQEPRNPDRSTLGRNEIIAAFRERVDARPGDRLRLRPQAARAHVFDAASGQRLD